MADVALAIEEVVTLAEHEFKDNRINLTLELEGGLPPIWAAEGQFHHIFMNLVRNAVQALSKARGDEPPERAGKSEIRIRAYPEAVNGKVAVEVADNGTGVPDDLKEKLFEPFFTTKRRGEGTGLGLYIVRQVVEDLGGSISVGDSDLGGASFTLRFPASRKGRSEMIG